MTRNEIIWEAKEIVYADGPSNVKEFTTEVLDKYGNRERLTAADYEALYNEVLRQANRVERFLFN